MSASPDQKGSQTKATGYSDELRILTALEAALLKQDPDPRTRFHEQFRKEADDYDRDVHEKYHDDLNTTLIFAGLFSAVASAFIVEIQSQIRPDYEQLSFAALTILLNVTSGVANQTPVPTWSGPDPSAVQAQAIMFASLASALLAAFLAMLGKQWLNLHVEGSFIDRNRHRELRMRGMITWRFKLVMECLPLIMQGSLLLLGYALARYFWDLSRKVSSVIIAFTAFGLAFYIFIVSAATFSKVCPFQTPISIALRLTFGRCRGGLAGAYETCREFLGLPATHQYQASPTLPSSDIDEKESEVRADSNCITTMFRMTNASESIMAIVGYIPEITWDRRMRSIPLTQVYRALRELLWRSPDGKALPRPGAEDQALSIAKALLHLYVQRYCMHGFDEALQNQVQIIGHQRQPLGHSDLDCGSDLKSTFYIVDWAFGVEPEIPWSDFELTENHHCWLGYIIQYRAWLALRIRQALPDDVKGFLEYSLKRGTIPDRVVADCLFTINMVVSCPDRMPESQELALKDRSHQIASLIDDVFDKLESIFKQNTPSGDISRGVEALELVVQLDGERIRTKSYALFRGIMGLVKSDGRLWASATLAMKGAYSSTEAVPPTGDLKDILDFLHFHISPPQGVAISGEPVYHAFRSIAIGAGADKGRGLVASNFNIPLLIDAVIQFLSNKDYMLLQRMSLLILPELDDLLFVSETTFNGSEERFVKAWSTAVSEFLRGVTVPQIQIEAASVKVLLAIANSERLRPYLLPEQWNLVYKFPTILYADSPSMKRCTNNVSILSFIKQSAERKVEELDKISESERPKRRKVEKELEEMSAGKLGWLGMLWMKYGSLADNVRDQLEAETQAIGSGPRCFDLDSYISMFNSELKRLQAIIESMEPLSRSVPGLRFQLDAMAKAKEKLVEIQEATRLARLASQRKARPYSPPPR